MKFHIYLLQWPSEKYLCCEYSDKLSANSVIMEILHTKPPAVTLDGLRLSKSSTVFTKFINKNDF